MADDRDARIAQLEAENAALRAENGDLREREVLLAGELEQRDGALVGALEQQAATVQILQAIAASPVDLQPVLETVLQSTMSLSASARGLLLIREGDHLATAAVVPFDAESSIRRYALTERRDAVIAFREGRSIHVPDRSDPALLDRNPDIAFRLPLASLSVPLSRGTEPIGVLTVLRDVARGFAPQEISTVEAFAAQAVIAIENARLFEELEQRNADLQASNRQVTEALEQQAATADVLRVIATSPTGLYRVLDAIIDAAVRLCDADTGQLLQTREDNGRLTARAMAGRQLREAPPLWHEDRAALIAANTQGLAATRESVAGRAHVERRAINVVDLAEAMQTEFPEGRQAQKRWGHRSALSVPLLRRGEPIGVLNLRRTEVRPFSEREVALLETFADQAVIAIENARLFEALQERTVALTQALEQQTAMAETLRIIASSPTDLERLLNSICEAAGRMTDAAISTVWRVDGDVIKLAGQYGGPRDFRVKLARTMRGAMRRARPSRHERFVSTMPPRLRRRPRRRRASSISPATGPLFGRPSYVTVSASARLRLPAPKFVRSRIRKWCCWRRSRTKP